MADSISHSDFIVVAQRGINRNAHINQRAEHSSSYRENLRLTRMTHVINERSGARLVFPVRPGTVSAMNKTVIEVQVRAVLPTSGGCAVFLGNNEKVFIIYVDQTVGSAITMFMRHITKERPLTHDLMAHLLAALGAKVERVIINDLKNATYYARVIIQVENELQQKKIIELDGRPSDCIAMATQQKAPIYVSQDVWDEVDDMSDVLRKMEEEGLKTDPEGEE
ncbi:MAG: Bifunctional nuclease [Candidatus Udaeobacter sp.]|nr:MAG: Bifunctional nuclease [Candidatus Udaeobacter sp.]